MAMSIVIYQRLHTSLGIASLTLNPGGCNKSTISCHLPGGFLGITPNLLTCMGVWDGAFLEGACVARFL